MSSFTNDLTKDSETDLIVKTRAWLQKFPLNLPVVVIPVFNAYEDTLECLESLVAAQSSPVPLVLLDDASTDDRIQSTFELLSKNREFLYVRKQKNSGFVGSVNLAFEACTPRDVVIVNSDTVLPSGWVERMQAAAYFRSNIATVTPLTNNGTLVSIPYRNKPISHLPNGMTTTQIDRKIQQSSLKLRPIIPTAIGHCVYFKRSALEAVGYFDEAFAPGYGEEVDFSQRAVQLGFCHVVADDVFIFHKGSRSFGADIERKKRLQEEHEQMLKVRYPWYHRWVSEVQSNSANTLAMCINLAKSTILGYRVAIDATSLSEVVTGTQVVTLELLKGLLQTRPTNVKVEVILADFVSEKVLQGLEKEVDHIWRFSALEALKDPEFDLIYRPFQINQEANLKILRNATNRLVICHLDNIAFSSPHYFDNWEQWLKYRNVTQMTFEQADGITFISKNALQDALHQSLDIPPERAKVCYVGVDHQIFQAAEVEPKIGKDFSNKPFLLVLGTNFKHKNRTHALRLFKVLLEKYGWEGHLVLAGPAVSTGGSFGEEALERLRTPFLNDKIHSLGAISEGEKWWLLKRAVLVLYVSNYEGFGIVPFEAAQVGTACISNKVTSLPEVLGDEIAYFEDNSLEPGAKLVWEFLNDKAKVQKQVELTRQRAEHYKWEQVAKNTWEFLDYILHQPFRHQRIVSRETLEDRLLEIEKEYKELANWANSLNKQLLAYQDSKMYKALTRFNFFK
jgi:GT2 family glycosyltransferase/glycosyltransferase involved in cell wall biosynthesis